MQTHEHACLPSLYVLEVIEPHSCVDPGYGKLHVGNIFDSSNVNTNMVSIAAIQVEDAIDRKLQPSSAPNPHGNGGNLLVISGSDKHFRLARQQVVVRRGPTVDELAIDSRWVGLEQCQSPQKPNEHQETIHVASNRDVYDS